MIPGLEARDSIPYPKTLGTYNNIRFSRDTCGILSILHPVPKNLHGKPHSSQGVTHYGWIYFSFGWNNNRTVKTRLVPFLPVPGTPR